MVLNLFGGKYLEQNTTRKESPLFCSKFIFILVSNYGFNTANVLCGVFILVSNHGFNTANVLCGGKRKALWLPGLCRRLGGARPLCSSA
ncbi:hypothetical protein I79_024040 [Cricetulus griseus]|uniref:Uncharacterized protein n=1 Tax=Cricetulus griseus TaxID=10029 RepID=G3IJK5_CRIGR|nr:hypothetical protein I79_024040 [Cricetulus griseus]